MSNEDIQRAYGIGLVETKEEEKMYKGCGKVAFENYIKNLDWNIKILKYEN